MQYNFNYEIEDRIKNYIKSGKLIVKLFNLDKKEHIRIRLHLYSLKRAKTLNHRSYSKILVEQLE